MDNNALITEIQINKNRPHFLHLRRIVACIAARLGMSGKDIEETESAINQVCSFGQPPECNAGNLSVKFTTNGLYMMVEITDPCAQIALLGDQGNAADNPQALECVRRLVDGLELIGNGEGSTVRITKFAENSRPAMRKPTPYTAAAGAASQK